MNKINKLNSWQTKQHTGPFWWNLQDAKEVSKDLSKRHHIYVSYIEESDANLVDSQQRYALTNRYDPNIKEINEKLAINSKEQ